MKTIKVKITRNPCHSWYAVGDIYCVIPDYADARFWRVPGENKCIDKRNGEIVTDTITVTADKIRAMAAKSPQVKEVLKEGFPECFEEDK